MTDQLEAVQRMQDYIADNLSQPITLGDLARVSRFSPWHAHRLFSQWTGLTPADYIRRLRLSRSALRLRDERARILDIALDAGFGSVDGYQRAFLREFGCNPHAYARQPKPLPLFYPYNVMAQRVRKELHMDTVKTVYIQEVEKPARRAIIRRGVKAEDYWAYCHEVGCDVWGLLKSMRSLCGEPVCLWLPARYIAPGTSKYVQGVEVAADYDGEIPEGFDVIDLPAAAYLMFRGEPFAEEDYAQAIGQVWEAIKKYDPAPAGWQWDDGSPRVQLEPIGTRGYIELMPVKRR